MKYNIEELKIKIKEYKKKVESEIFFDSDNHLYCRKKDNFLLTGVTTILDVRTKGFLVAWAAKEVYNYLKENWNIAKTYTEDEKEELLLAGKKAYVRKSDKGKSFGKDAHEWIKEYIGFKIKGIDQKQAKPEGEEVLNCVNAFLDWERRHEVEWLASELMVWSPTNLYAGTVDFLSIIDSFFTIGDFKTSKVLSEEVCLQTAGYVLALEETGIFPEKRMVIRLPKDGSPVEAINISTNLKFDQKIFLSLREIYRWNLYIENNFCGKSGKIAF